MTPEGRSAFGAPSFFSVFHAAFGLMRIATFHGAKPAPWAISDKRLAALLASFVYRRPRGRMQTMMGGLGEAFQVLDDVVLRVAVFVVDVMTGRDGTEVGHP
jgi:hypothetical protein